MRAISLFSGVGGFDLGFERAGIETVIQVEQDKHALAVLERHWPDVERLTDVRDVGEGWKKGARRGAVGAERAQPDAEHDGVSLERSDSDVDLIYGGFPCQDVSVAGKRAGLGGERSGLWFEFERIVSELRPRWVVIENVPGLLSSNGGADFAVILTGLDQLGFDASWAILDSQHFGVPQRRRRVFVVGGPRGRGAEQVLSLCESCGGNPETGGTPGQDTTSTPDGGAHSPGGVANPLGAHHGRNDLDHDTYVTASAITASAGHHGHSSPRGDGSDNLLVDDQIGTMTANWHKGAGNTQVEMGIVQPTDAGVRRLTPTECERLQGFPDGWTAGQADSHRYKQMGNAVTVPVAEWIGHRLVAVDRGLS